MAEVEISVLTGQCLDRRMGSQVIVANEIGAWDSERNAARATITILCNSRRVPSERSEISSPHG
jgi:hypothetical protein